MRKTFFSAGAQLIGLPTGVIKRMLSGAYQIESAACKDGRTEAFMRDFCSWMEQCVRKNNSDCVCIIVGVSSPGSFPQAALDELKSFVGKCNGVKQFYWGLSHDPNVSSMDITGIMNLNYAQPLDLQQQTNIIHSKCKRDILSAMMKSTTPSEVDMLYAAKWLEDNYASDGIMYKGVFELNDYLDWRRLEEGNESQQWQNSNVRLMVVTKSQPLNNGPAWDMRANSIRKKEKDEYAKLENSCLDTIPFNKSIAFVVYGIMSMLLDPQNTMPNYGSFTTEDVLKGVDLFPYAWINRSKLGTNGTLASWTEEHRFDYDSYTIEQIRILNPKVIVCCGRENRKNSMIEILNANGFHFRQTVKVPEIWVEDEKHMLAIDSALPFVSVEDFYDGCVVKLHDFIMFYPIFLIDHKQR